MEDKLTIRVNIVDRYYPLKIERRDEEKIRMAAKRINDTVIQYKQTYAEKDSQDFLAMAALQYVTKMIEKDQETDILPIYEELSSLEKELDEVFEKE